MSKEERNMSKEEKEKFLQEIIAADVDLPSVGPSKPPRDRSKNLSQKLTNYIIVVGASVSWASRQAYLELIQNFLSKKIDGITFQSEFLSLRGQNMSKANEICEKIEDGLKPIPDFYYTSKADDFDSEINDLFFPVEAYVPVEAYDSDIDDSDDPDIDDSYWDEICPSENKLRSIIQEKFVPRFQQSCDLNDSFFRPQVDLD